MRQYPEAYKKAVVSKWIESGLSLPQFSQRESISLSTETAAMSVVELSEYCHCQFLVISHRPNVYMTVGCR
ncbi:hypothetical protein P0F03_003091 [Vibrio metschnikovii]|nr:hypothetical protein [Vibrio metschnikovii]